ncbi:MAG: hypothetical protein ACLGI5_07815 [Thermoleophilia bacterium]
MRQLPAAVVLLVALGGAAPGAHGAPEPLWVPDPQQLVGDAGAPADARLEVAAPVALDSPVADDPSRVAVAHWMASAAREAGLPGELPVMAALVESGLRNLPYGHADSVGLFQMRLSVWDSGAYEGYLARPELQLRWFVEHAIAVRDARRAGGDDDFGDDPASWGEWIADIERPFEAYRGRYAERLDEARTLLALPAPAVAPFELGLTVGGAATPVVDPAGAELAERVLADAAITLDERARADLAAHRVDPRVTALLLQAAARAPIGIWVFQTGHSYYTVNGSVSNHSFGRAVDIGSVGGAPVSASNAAARDLALALGRLDGSLRPTEIGTPWAIDEPGYFTDGDHRDHLHIGFDGRPAAAAAAAASEPPEVTIVPVRRRAASPAEPRFDAGARSGAGAGGDGEPRFEVAR